MVDLNIRALTSNFSIALAVQFLSFAVSAATSFLVPKALSVDHFGYWQLFLFYVGYIGFLQFGLNDGVYLRFGGRTRESIDHQSITQQFAVSIISQILVASMLGLSSFLLVNDLDRKAVIISIAVMTPLCNCAWYLGYVFQAINETKLYSYSVLISRVAFLLPLVVLLVLRIDQYGFYVAAYVIGQVLSLVYCLAKSKGLLTRLKSGDMRRAAFDSCASIKVGIKLLVATLASSLMLGCSRFVIDAIWDISTFGLVSIAFAVVSFFLTSMAQASMVLFPVMRQASKEEYSGWLKIIRNFIIIILPAAYPLYFALSLLLLWWLPDYAYALELAALLMPVCVFDGIFQTVHLTYFKVARKEKHLMRLNIGAVAIVALLVCLTGYGLHDLRLVVLSPTLVIVLRAFVADRMMAGAIGGFSHQKLLSCVALTVVFLMAKMLLSDPMAGFAVVTSYIVFLYINRHSVFDVIKRWRYHMAEGDGSGD
ncbi:hypothetical protein [Gordonibacter pamelaeae]|uniref:hypothetical protein n=1 Tax=Gordonibacter pamelaeae TaxID=471189 RepID=UPI00242C746B|nr:hypothetical protein [Gordonibacter pamelaeae]